MSLATGRGVGRLGDWTFHLWDLTQTPGRWCQNWIETVYVHKIICWWVYVWKLFYFLRAWILYKLTATIAIFKKINSSPKGNFQGHGSVQAGSEWEGIHWLMWSEHLMRTALFTCLTLSISSYVNSLNWMYLCILLQCNENMFTFMNENKILRRTHPTSVVQMSFCGSRVSEGVPHIGPGGDPEQTVIMAW
jgi:hypothetical protein